MCTLALILLLVYFSLIVKSATFHKPDVDLGPEPIWQKDKRLISPSQVPLDQCPVTDLEKEVREHQFGRRCPEGKPYVCGQDLDNNYIVEQCHEIIKCEPGSAPTTVVNDQNGKFVMTCKGCSSTKYSPFPVSTEDEPANGCRRNRQNNDLDQQGIHMIDPGSTTTMANFTCDSAKFYYDEYHKMYCNNKDPCVCVYARNHCNTTHPDLLPNGDCEEACDGRRDKHHNFICLTRNVADITTPPATSHHTKEMPNLMTTAQTDPTTKPSNDERSASDGSIIYVVIPIIVVAVILIIIGVYCWRKWLKKRCNTENNRKRSDGYTLSPSPSSSSTGESDSKEDSNENTSLMTGDSSMDPDTRYKEKYEDTSKHTACRPIVIRDCKNVVVGDHAVVHDGNLGMSASQRSDNLSEASVPNTNEDQGNNQQEVRIDKTPVAVQHDPNNKDRIQAQPVFPDPNETAHDTATVLRQVGGPNRQPTDANAAGGSS